MMHVMRGPITLSNDRQRNDRTSGLNRALDPSVGWDPTLAAYDYGRFLSNKVVLPSIIHFPFELLRLSRRGGGSLLRRGRLVQNSFVGCWWAVSVLLRSLALSTLLLLLEPSELNE